MLREYGVHDVFTVREDVPIADYYEYFDVIGTGTLNGRKYKHVRVYKGSSKMDTAEFTRLINGMRDECILQGIDVKTPTEIAAMKYVRGE
jgi:hypothetical protein